MIVAGILVVVNGGVQLGTVSGGVSRNSVLGWILSEVSVE